MRGRVHSKQGFLPIMHKLLPLLLIMACSPLTEQQRYDSDDRLIQAREQYELRRQACRQNGGIMEIRSHGKLGRHDYADYKLAHCVRSNH